ncbi:MAG: secretion system protein [Dethiosulfovibrio peptidovorans]|nr:MAG: secretion system protein [Dethiosulfovibrio peptidovorans]
MKFNYRARRQDGSVETGNLDVADSAAAATILRQRGFLPLSIDAVKGSAAATRRTSASVLKKKKGSSDLSFMDKLSMIGTVPVKDKAVFFRQLATMIKAGVTIGGSLDILIEQTKNKRLAYAISQVKKEVDGGVSISRAMSTRSIFPPLAVSIIRAGEEGGSLDESMERVADFLERQNALQKKIVSASTYPAVVMFFALVVVVVLITVIMPKFSKVFKNLGVELPKMTKILFAVGIWSAENWPILLVATLILVGIIVFLARWTPTRPFMDRVKLRLPVFGGLLFQACIARTTRTLSSLTHSGIPILQALDMTGDVAGNVVFQTAFDDLEAAARKGRGLGETARGIKIFPPMVAHMLRVGEETGQVDDMLAKVADWFEMELDETIKRLTSILEPVLIVFVGVVVGAVAMAIFSPIVTAIQTML